MQRATKASKELNNEPWRRSGAEPERAGLAAAWPAPGSHADQQRGQQDSIHASPRALMQRQQLGHIFGSAPGATLQRQKGIAPGSAVRVYVAESDKTAEATVVAATLAEEAYLVRLVGEDQDREIDQTYVFPADMSENEVRRAIEPLRLSVEINSAIDPKSRLKSHREKTLSDQSYAPRKMLANRAMPVDGKDAKAAISAVVRKAAGFVELHPFSNANGRTMLYMMYFDAIEAGWVIDMSPLQLHGIALGEDQKERISRKTDKVIDAIVQMTLERPPEFDVARYLAAKLQLLLSLEADREQRVDMLDLQDREQRARVLQGEKAKKADTLAVLVDAYKQFLLDLPPQEARVVGQLVRDGVIWFETDSGRDFACASKDGLFDVVTFEDKEWDLPEGGLSSLCDKLLDFFED